VELETKVNLFFIGGPKTGSTALHQLLDQHPNIYMAKDKEPHFFCQDYHDEALQLHQGKWMPFKYRNLKTYLELFKDADNQTYLGDASTTYVHSSVAAQNIYEHNKDARFIAVLRDPVELLKSWYSHLVYMGHETALDLKTAWSRDFAKMKLEDFPENCSFQSSLDYKRILSLHHNLERYFTMFKKENILVILQRDLLNEPQTELNRIWKFLDLDAQEIKSVIANKRKSVRFKRLKSTIDSQFIKNFKVKYYSKRDSVLFKTLRTIYRATFLNKKVKELEVDTAFEQELKYEFKTQVEHLARLTGIDLVRKWNY